jgi:hypothetical protein
MYHFVAAIILFTVFIILGCDRGLTPPPPDTTITLGGVVHFEGKLPVCDSILYLDVVLSEDPPPFSIASVFANYGKTIWVLPLNTCPLRDTSFSFSLKPGTYRYLGIIEKYGMPDSLTLDWQIIGFAHTPNDSALAYSLIPGSHVDSIILRARFDSIPRQPFVK